MSNEKAKSQNRPPKKCRYFSAVCYPESSPTFVYDWMKSNANVCWVLHDKDVYDKDVYDNEGVKIHSVGEKKKSHYHIILAFAGPSTLANAQRVLKDDFGINENMVEYISNIVGACRYLTHKDNLTKHQYLDKDVHYKALFDYEKFTNLHTESNSLIQFKHVFSIIREFGFSNFADLVDYSLSLEDDEHLFEFLMSGNNANLVEKYLKGNYFRTYANKELDSFDNIAYESSIL